MSNIYDKGHAIWRLLSEHTWQCDCITQPTMWSVKRHWTHKQTLKSHS